MKVLIVLISICLVLLVGGCTYPFHCGGSTWFRSCGGNKPRKPAPKVCYCTGNEVPCDPKTGEPVCPR